MWISYRYVVQAFVSVSVFVRALVFYKAFTATLTTDKPIRGSSKMREIRIQMKTGINCLMRYAGGGLREACATAENLEAVIRPTLCSNHNPDCD